MPKIRISLKGCGGVKRLIGFLKDKRKNIIRHIQSEKHKQNAVIFGRFFMCILSSLILVMATLSYGWFIHQRDVFTDSIPVDVKAPDDIIVSTTVHACIGIGLDENGSKYFSKQQASTNDLKKFMLLKENERQLLLHIHFEEPDMLDKISLTASTNTDFFLGDGNHPLLTTSDGRGEEYDNVLSSIIAFYVVTPVDATFESQEAYKIESASNPHSFIDKDDYSVTNELTLLENHPPQDIYLMLDYDYDLVLKIFSENFGNISFTRPDGSLLDEVFYVWDIDLEITKE